MSSYVSFWVKNKKGQVTPLFSYSRSNMIYEAMNECGCRADEEEHAVPFTLDMASEVRNWLDCKLAEDKKHIREYQEKIEMIKDFKNSTLEERLAAIEDYQEYIDESKDEINSINFAIDIIILIGEIREENYSTWNAPREEKDKVIWAGIDCCMAEDDKEDEK